MTFLKPIRDMQTEWERDSEVDKLGLKQVQVSMEAEHESQRKSNDVIYQMRYSERWSTIPSARAPSVSHPHGSNPLIEEKSSTLPEEMSEDSSSNNAGKDINGNAAAADHETTLIKEEEESSMLSEEEISGNNDSTDGNNKICDDKNNNNTHNKQRRNSQLGPDGPVMLGGRKRPPPSSQRDSLLVSKASKRKSTMKSPMTSRRMTNANDLNAINNDMNALRFTDSEKNIVKAGKVLMRDISKKCEEGVRLNTGPLSKAFFVVDECNKAVFYGRSRITVHAKAKEILSYFWKCVKWRGAKQRRKRGAKRRRKRGANDGNEERGR